VTREERLAANEAVFREVNERISTISGESPAERIEILCECVDDGCTLGIILGRSDYEQLRASSTQFAVVPGHEQPDVETVVARQEGYSVVEKTGVGADLARASDPR
jgi:hypothetical protein